jgi:hypothetical protein
MEVLPTPDQELRQRLAGAENRLDPIGERLGRLELPLGDTVAVQDLPSQLARHRDLIVAEVRAAAAPAPPPSPSPAPPTTEVGIKVDGPPYPEPEPDIEVDGSRVATAVAERRRADRLRRRQA